MIAQRATEPGSKFDAGKPRLDLIAPEFLLDIGKVLDFGAQKYGDRNWERGMSWSRAYAALQRHMLAWWSGEAVDAETGLSHLAHAGCCLMFLAAFEKRGAGTDDRAPVDFVEKAKLEDALVDAVQAALTWPISGPIYPIAPDEILEDGKRV